MMSFWLLNAATRTWNRTHCYFSLMTFKGDCPAWIFSCASMVCASWKNPWDSPSVSRRNMLWKKVLFCEEINIENHLVNSSLPWTFSFFHLSFTHKHMYTGAKEKTLKCFMLKTHCKPYYFFFKHNHTLVNDLLQEMEMHCSEEAQQSM